MSKTVKELAALISGTVIGDDSLIIEGITNIENPVKGHITFVQDERSFKRLEATEIACLITPKNITSSSKVIIQSEYPKLAWAKLMGLFYPTQKYSGKISEKAHIDPTSKIGKNVTIEPFASIGENAEIGDNAVIRSHSYIDKNVKIGSSSVVHPNVMIYFDSIIGNSVIIHSSSVIGTDGFGYVATPQGQEKVPQVGNVIIEDNVEIGALVTVDRATLGSTRIGKGCKIDNLVQIAHNVSIGNHTVISAQTGISGSSKIGNHVTMGGKVGVADHVEIEDWVMVGAGAGIPTGKKIRTKQIVFGEPARPYQQARKQIAAQLRAAETLEELKSLRKRVEELEKASGTSKVS